MIELGEFDIKFMPRTTIKGQAITNFVVEFTYMTKALGMATDDKALRKGAQRVMNPLT